MKYEEQEFGQDRVQVDGNEYTRCKFRGTVLTYSGSHSVVFDGCVFDGCIWQFEGPAANTLAFLAALYKGGAGHLVEMTFNSIRGLPT